MRRLGIAFILLAMPIAILPHQSGGEGLSAQQESYLPKGGYVPNESVAAEMAEIVLKPIYGATAINRQKPFKVVRRNDTWIVQGNAHGAQAGVFIMKIDKVRGTIMYLLHYR